MGLTVLSTVGLLFAGLLAGAEVVVRYGVRGPLAALDDAAHIRMRQALIRTLRVLVPALYLPALLLGVAGAIIGGAATRWAGVAALLVWTAATFFGTVPINEAALGWAPDAPPADWVALVERWERLNTVRTVAAVAAFCCFLAAVAGRLPH
jgi:hypothetical protein